MSIPGVIAAHPDKAAADPADARGTGAAITPAQAAPKRFPKAPAHPERVCWGCDRYCPAKSMRCGNGSDRTQHPAELFGDDWDTWGQGA